ncbi:MAG: hypothetical protein HYT30_00700 [Parcubacteria group bacterium]|nr:hypothetical protein [Parcubacteria group bacterium]
MPKDYFRDITPPEKSPPSKTDATGGVERSIRNIPIAHRRERGPNFPATETVSDLPASARETITPRSSSAFSFSRIAVWGLAVVVVLALGFVVYALSQGTSVVATPRTHTVALTEDVLLSAYPVGSEQATQGTLAYEVGEKSYDMETSVDAHGFSEVEEFASGIITVYNEHSEKSVRLIKNTRFESPAGLIFRIRDSAVVPGKKGTTPGTLSVTVYADQAGEKYNIGPTDRFTIPGLKGGDMYDRVYGRSAAAFTGGFVGSKPKVADADLEAARSALRAQLEQKARADMQSTSLEGKVSFPQLTSITFEPLPFDVSADGKALVRERALVRVPVFPESLLARTLAAATRADAGDASIRMSGIEGLQVRRAATDTSAQALGTAPIDMLFSGNVKLVWNVDAAALVSALVGTPKANFQNTVAQFTSIQSADAFVRPFWRDTFPSDPAGIEVIVKEVN